MKCAITRIIAAATSLSSLPIAANASIFNANRIPWSFKSMHRCSRNTLCDSLTLRGGSDNSRNDEGRYYDYRQEEVSGRRRSGSYDSDYPPRDPDNYETRDGNDRYNYDYGGNRDEENNDYPHENPAEDDGYYQQDNYSRSRSNSNVSPRRQSKNRSPSSFLPTSIPGITLPNRKVGILMLGSGLAITVLGIFLFFNKTLLRMGNILFILGVPLTIGTGRTMGYFLQPKKARATACLSFGIFLVLVGWPVIGIAMEVFGLLNLVGNMFPIFLIMARRIPYVGDLIPDGSKSKKKSSAGRPNYEYEQKRRDEDRYNYDDERERNDPERYY